MVCAEGNGSGPPGSKQEIAFSYCGKFLSDKVAFEAEHGTNIIQPDKRSFKEMRHGHKAVTRPTYMADHNIMLIVLLRHLRIGQGIDVRSHSETHTS